MTGVQTCALPISALALLASATGFCAGCEIYKLGARLRGIYGDTLHRVDRSDFGITGDDSVTILFSHPLCTDCHRVEREFDERGLRLVGVDVRERRDLARKYGVSVVPTLVRVEPDGTAALLTSPVR